MKPCPRCARHVRVSDSACPFCATPLATVGASSLVVVALLGAMTVACGPSVTAGDAGADDAGGDTSTSDSSGPGQTDAGPGPVTTAGDSTTDDVEMTSTTSQGTDSGTDDPLDGGAGFLYGPPDMGSPFDCDLEAQDCPVGDKCMPWANDGGPVWTATRCSPVAEDPGQALDPCSVEGSDVSGIDDCDLGLMCFFVDASSNEGQCRPLCLGDVMCDAGQACAPVVSDLVELCLDTCDPMVDMCPDGQSCEQLGDTTVCAPPVD